VTFRAALRARAAGRKARLIFPEAADPRVRQATRELERLAIAEPILLGINGNQPASDPRLREVADFLRKRRPQAVKDGRHALELASDPVRFAAAMVALGDADGCVAGASTTTADVVRAALWAIGAREGSSSVSSAMYLGLPDGRVLTYTDIGVVPTPTPRQLAESALAAAFDRTALVGDRPVVAFLSYSTHGSAGGDDVERVKAAVDLFREMAPGVTVDGELQLDAAIVPEVAARKSPGSPVAGAANVLVFPCLDAGNIGYKLTERLADASAAGPLLQGLARPMSDLSRGAEVDDIVDVAALVALQATAAP
jgi:phosphate acetyltransferase